MSELGESVHDAFDFLDKFLKDVAKLVRTVEERMVNNKKIFPLGDAATFWDHSRAHYAPAKWMPKYVTRNYSVKINTGPKSVWKTSWIAFFIVYLNPEQFKEPVAAWGIATQDEQKDMWKILKNFGLYQQSPEFFDTVPALEWEHLENLPRTLSSFKYQIRYLVDIDNAKKVDNVVIDPLLTEIKNMGLI